MEPITINLSDAAVWTGTGLLGVIALLLAALMWFLRRELTNNDKAHADLRNDVKTVETDVKKLLSGDVPWVRTIMDRLESLERR